MKGRKAFGEISKRAVWLFMRASSDALLASVPNKMGIQQSKSNILLAIRSLIFATIFVYSSIQRILHIVKPSWSKNLDPILYRPQFYFTQMVAKLPQPALNP